MLLFAGRGSAFAEEHNSAFFIENQELVILDCPATAFQKYKTLDFQHIQHIYILVTHTHGDHISGIGLMIQFAWFILKHKIPVTVIAPSKCVKEDLQLLLTRIEGCEEEWFTLLEAEEIQKDWLIKAIPTEHVLPLKGKCFGWQLNIRHKNVIYTGDTATLNTFLPYLTKGSVLYSEASCYDSKVHLYLPETMPVFLNLIQNDIQIYLMHLDNQEAILEMIQNTEIHLAPLYWEK